MHSKGHFQRFWYTVYRKWWTLLKNKEVADVFNSYFQSITVVLYLRLSGQFQVCFFFYKKISSLKQYQNTKQKKKKKKRKNRLKIVLITSNTEVYPPEVYLLKCTPFNPPMENLFFTNPDTNFLLNLLLMCVHSFWSYLWELNFTCGHLYEC